MAVHCLGNPFPPIHHFVGLQIVIRLSTPGIINSMRMACVDFEGSTKPMLTIGISFVRIERTD